MAARAAAARAGGIGKEALALAFAQALLCETPRADGLACGECPSCRYAIAGQHPDLMRVTQVSFDDDGDPVWKETIGIDRIRDVTAFTQLTTHRQRAKVVVIAPAERMNANAANALLKTLEEPPPATYLMLVAAAPGRLPATIVSRCRKLPVAVPGRGGGGARGWRRRASRSRRWRWRRPAARRSRRWRSPMRAGRASAAPGSPRSPIPPASRCSRSPRGSTPAARTRAGRGSPRRSTCCWAGRPISPGSPRARPPRVHPDCAAALARLAPRVAPLPLFRYHRALLRQRALLAHPLQPRLVAEAMLLDYRALFAPA